ncbi:MAG: molybdenum cofactor guanylyltransferase [Lachnospirales bacterium]
MSLVGVIILGGKNTRMGGEKKAFLKYKDKCFYEHILNSMRKVDKIYLSVEDKSLYENLDYELIEDIHKEIGPIGGLYSIFKNCKEDAFLVLPSDVPLINDIVVNELIETYKKSNKPVVLIDNKDYPNPLIAIYTRDCMEVVEKMIENKNYKMKNILSSIDYDTVKYKDLCLDEKFINDCNDKVTYEKLIKE